MKHWIWVVGLLSVVCAHAADKPEYKVGDRLPAATGKAVASYRETSWDDLLPKGWDPLASFKHLDLSKLKDGDPRADEALQNLKKAWDAAPANEVMNKSTIRIAGFLVPLEWGDKKRHPPLWWAFSVGDFDMARLLLKLGAQPGGMPVGNL